MIIALLAMFKAWLLPILSQGTVEVFKVIFYVGLAILGFNYLLRSINLKTIKLEWLLEPLAKVVKFVGKYLWIFVKWFFVTIYSIIPRFYKWISLKLSATSLPEWAQKAIAIATTILLIAAII